MDAHNNRQTVVATALKLAMGASALFVTLLPVVLR